jgi:hypothetical protein
MEFKPTPIDDYTDTQNTNNDEEQIISLPKVDITKVAELREYDQYFFSQKVLDTLVSNLKYESNIVCLCTPALANAFSIEGKETTCLDIDKRFDYLKGYKYFDILKPECLDFKPDVIIFDPPFFNINYANLCIHL